MVSKKASWVKGYCHIPLEKWCKLCDALVCAPDNDIDFVIKKIEVLQKNLQKYAEKGYFNKKR